MIRERRNRVRASFPAPNLANRQVVYHRTSGEESVDDWRRNHDRNIVCVRQNNSHRSHQERRQRRMPRKDR